MYFFSFIYYNNRLNRSNTSADPPPHPPASPHQGSRGLPGLDNFILNTKYILVCIIITFCKKNRDVLVCLLCTKFLLNSILLIDHQSQN